MSYSFEMLVDADVALDDAEAFSKSIINEFQKLGLIEREPNPDCVLGGSGYPPSMDVFDLYDLQPGEPYLTIHNSGVEPIVKRSYNQWALGQSCRGFTCPDCLTGIPWHHREFQKSFMKSIDAWLKNMSTANVMCPYCEREAIVTRWHGRPPLGFGNLAFRFWNWPPFNSPHWQIHIPTLVRDMTGHTIIETWAEI